MHYIHVSMRDERMKKEVSKVKQTTRQSNKAHVHHDVLCGLKTHNYHYTNIHMHS